MEFQPSISHIEWIDAPTKSIDRGYHIWKVHIARDIYFFKSHDALLKEADWNTIRKFRHIEDQQIRIISLLFPRLVIASYLNLQPSEIRFKRNEFGKPWIENNPSFLFNIAHNRNYFLFICGMGSCGVDVEQQKHIPLEPYFLKEIFHKEELDYLNRQANQEEAFFKLWVLKEALFKQLGTGIPDKLHSFSIFDKALNQGGAALDQKPFVQSVYRLSDNHFLGLNYQGDAETPLRFIDFEKGKEFCKTLS